MGWVGGWDGILMNGWDGMGWDRIGEWMDGVAFQNYVFFLFDRKEMHESFLVIFLDMELVKCFVRQVTFRLLLPLLLLLPPLLLLLLFLLLLPLLLLFLLILFLLFLNN